MISVVQSQREVLLSPTGTNVWSGQVPQSLNSAAVTWSLAKQLYGFNGPYWIIPLSLVIGMAPTTAQWMIWKVPSAFLPALKQDHADFLKFHLLRNGPKSDPSKLTASCFQSYTWWASLPYSILSFLYKKKSNSRHSS